MKIWKRFGSRASVTIISIWMVGSAGMLSAQDEPGPFERLFRSMRKGFQEPRHKSVSHQSGHKQETAETEASPSGQATAHATGDVAGKPPSAGNTRTTTRATAKKGQDLPYGTPVPGKKGFVTSPFAPNSGYIDVRGFSPGTPVRDPYTDKVFLTP